MREIFRGFYSESEPIEKVLKSRGVRIVLDTNVLFSLYRVHEATREQLFEVLDSVKEKLWIPYHVALEYQRNRLDVIRTLKDDFKDLEANITNLQNAFAQIKAHPIPKRIPHLLSKTEQFEKKLNVLIANYRKSVTGWHKRQLDVSDPDPIRPRLDKLFEGKIGLRPKPHWLKEVQKEGADRFKCSVPPGNCDEKTDNEGVGCISYDGLTYQRKFAEFIIWKQTLEMAAAADNVNAIVFVTDDTKDDWFHSVGGSKTGVKAELRAEMCSQGDVEKFYLVTADRFFRLASEAFTVYVDESSISDVKDTVSSPPPSFEQEGIISSPSPDLQNRGSLLSSFLFSTPPDYSGGAPMRLVPDQAGFAWSFSLRGSYEAKSHDAKLLAISYDVASEMERLVPYEFKQQCTEYIVEQLKKIAVGSYTVQAIETYAKRLVLQFARENDLVAQPPPPSSSSA